jgi:ribose 5-phosphate isomerase A
MGNDNELVPKGARETEKCLAAQAAAEVVEDGMVVGLGTGTTVAYLLPALASRKLSLRCVATSPRTEEVARSLGLHVEPFTMDRVDLAIDGADQISPEGWLVKGGGGAHTREKLVAIAAERFVVIADSTKMVPALHAPVPLELIAFGLGSTLARLGTVRRREVPLSPNGGIIADFFGEVGNPATLAVMLEATLGVMSHGLFRPEMVSTIFVGRGGAVQRTDYPHQTS